MTDVVSAPGPDNDAAGEPTDVAAALADAGAEILRALTSPDARARRRHIAKAQKLLSVACSAGPDDEDATDRASGEPRGLSGE